MTVVVLSVAAFTGLSVAEWCRCRPPRPEPIPPAPRLPGWAVGRAIGNPNHRLPADALTGLAGREASRAAIRRARARARARHHQIGATP